jgi:hypothetical protein
MIRIRKAAERGHFDHGWLETYHPFSSGDYYDLVPRPIQRDPPHVAAARVLGRPRQPHSCTQRRPAASMPSWAGRCGSAWKPTFLP